MKIIVEGYATVVKLVPQFQQIALVACPHIISNEKNINLIDHLSSAYVYPII